MSDYPLTDAFKISLDQLKIQPEMPLWKKRVQYVTNVVVRITLIAFPFLLGYAFYFKDWKAPIHCVTLAVFSGFSQLCLVDSWECDMQQIKELAVRLGKNPAARSDYSRRPFQYVLRPEFIERRKFLLQQALIKTALVLEIFAHLDHTLSDDENWRKNLIQNVDFNPALKAQICGIFWNPKFDRSSINCLFEPQPLVLKLKCPVRAAQVKTT